MPENPTGVGSGPPINAYTNNHPQQVDDPRHAARVSVQPGSKS